MSTTRLLKARGLQTLAWSVVDPKTQRKLKILAAAEGLSMQDYVAMCMKGIAKVGYPAFLKAEVKRLHKG